MVQKKNFLKLVVPSKAELDTLAKRYPEGISGKRNKRGPRPISRLCKYRDSGLVKNKLDLFILVHIIKRLNSTEIERKLRRTKGIKKIKRRAIDLREARICMEAKQYVEKLASDFKKYGSHRIYEGLSKLLVSSIKRYQLDI